jgi:hypothetical protein
MERNTVTQRIAVGLTLLAALFATACGEDTPQPAQSTLVFRSQPASVRAGERLGTVELALVDASGNVMQDRGGTVQLSLVNAPPDGGQLGGTTRVVLAAGIAQVTDLTVARAAAGMRLEARMGEKTTQSSAFTVRPAAPARLALTSGPTDVDAGGVLPPLRVSVQDAFGNLADEAVTVTAALEGGTTGAILEGTRTAQPVAGVASFNELSVDKDGEGYVLAFSSGSLPVAHSAPFNVRPGVPVSLSFTSQPMASTVAGVTLPVVQVALRDRKGNVAKRAQGDVTVALVADNGATLAGTATVAVTGGTATFDALSIQRAGAGYLLRASFGTLAPADSSAFAITPAAAARLVYVTAPGAAVAGAAFAPAVQVEVQDTYGNRTASTVLVEVALVANPGNATLNGTRLESAVAGVATFSDLSLNVAAQGYTLQATSGALTPATSNLFDVAPAAPAAVTFLQQPGNILAGEAFEPAVRVAVNDAFGNRATNVTGNVNIVLGQNPGGATLSGTSSVALSNGEASFGNLTLDRAGTGYTLAASFGALTAVESSTFQVSPAAATLLFVSAPTGNVTAGAAFSAEVEFRDAFGNRTPSRATVSLRLSDNANGATLLGVTARSAVNGVATFPGLSVERAGTGYTLEASSGSLAVVLSGAFNVNPAAASALAVITQPPETVVAGEAMAAFAVEARDRYNNPVPTFGNADESIQVGVDPSRDPNGATVSGAARLRDPVNGVVTWTGLSLDKAGATELYFIAYDTFGAVLFTGYSRPVNVTPAAAAGIAFRRVPAQGTAGSALGPAVQVQVTDRFGNATQGSGDVTLSLGANPGGDTLRGTLTAAVSEGVATFADLVLEKAGVGYTLKAAMTGVPVVTSPAFTIVGAEPTRLAYVTQPRSTPNGLPLNEVAVSLVDAFGNRASSSAEVTVALSSANGAVLGGTVTVAAQNGLARFGNLSVDRNGQDYVLAASSGALQGVDSSAFDVYGAALAYTDPAQGRIRLMRNPASTNSRLVLDVVVAEDLTGYGAGFNLPLDATKVQLAAQGAINPGAALSAGTTVPALAAALPDSGPMAGVLTSGISQKAAGAGAVATDTAIPAGSVLYQLALELRPGAEPGVVFDGASLGNRFRGLLRNKLGDDVVGNSGFGIGRLEITGG